MPAFLNAHQLLIKKMKDLGLRVDELGMCYVYAPLAMEAMQAHVVKTFNQHLSLILTASAADLECSGVSDLLEDMESFDEIREKIQRSLVPIDIVEGSYPQAELATYLRIIRETALKMRYPKTITFLLGSVDHVVALGYNPQKNCWLLGDITSSLLIKEWTEAALLANIMPIFFCEHHVSLSTEMWAAHEDEKIAEEFFAACRLHPLWKIAHAITPERAQEIDASGGSWLYLAVENGHLEDVETLLENGANPNQICLRNGDEGVRPLLIAVERGYHRIATILLEAGADPNHACQWMGATPLYTATALGDSEMMVLLLKKGANPNQPVDEGMTPMMAAVELGDLKKIKVLLEHEERTPSSLMQHSFLNKAHQDNNTLDSAAKQNFNRAP
ncbi:MAG: ankyrin repeat domain-containing protein [Gammaproteobacteria bacterium]|nr:MAG: ankyrin repeat domain-containing protein [Gammaproteobacteria bacterium]